MPPRKIVTTRKEVGGGGDGRMVPNSNAHTIPAMQLSAYVMILGRDRDHVRCVRAAISL